MSKAGKALCECGCGERDYFNRLRILEIEATRDESRRIVWPSRRFYVKREHYRPFLVELQAVAALEELVRYYIRTRQPWWRKIWKFRTVVRLQFVIHSRLKGMEICKRQSLRSGILFVVPNWMGKILSNYWLWSNTHTLVWSWRGPQAVKAAEQPANGSEAQAHVSEPAA